MKGRPSLPWDSYSQDLGFEDEADMWYHFFELDCQPFSCVADLICVETATIRYRLKRHGYKFKGRGGPNNVAATKRRWYMRARNLGFASELDMLKPYRWDYGTLAKQLEVSEYGVRSRLRKYGLVPNSYSKSSPKFRALREKIIVDNGK